MNPVVSSLVGGCVTSRNSLQLWLACFSLFIVTALCSSVRFCIESESLRCCDVVVAMQWLHVLDSVLQLTAG